MAKKKKKAAPQSFSPEKYIKEQARKMPIVACYATADWKTDMGIVQATVVRQRNDGNFLVGSYLVDTYCLGVKDVFYNSKVDQSELDQMLEHWDDSTGLEPADYAEVHNLIYGAVEFAEEAGIRPCQQFGVCQYVLEEDDEKIPLIEYEYGLNGRYYLENRMMNEKRYLPILERNLGVGNFDYVDRSNMFDNFDSEEMLNVVENLAKRVEEYPDEPYSYVPTMVYPSSPKIKHKILEKQIFSEESEIPVKELKKILALPQDEVIEDLGNIIYYVIGNTRRDDDKEFKYFGCELLKCVPLLTHYGDARGLDPLLEIMRQNENFVEAHLGTFAIDSFLAALYSMGPKNLDAIEGLWYTPGINTYYRATVSEAMRDIAYYHPELRDDILSRFDKLMDYIIERLPERRGCDSHSAAMAIWALSEMRAKEFLPRIKELCDTGLVDLDISGEYEDIVKLMDQKERTVKGFGIPNFDIMKELGRN